MLAILLVASSSWAAETAPARTPRQLAATAQRQQHYADLYRRGVLRGDTLLNRYADRLKVTPADPQDNESIAVGEIKLHKEVHDINVRAGRTARLRYGKEATQIDQHAHVVQVDLKQGKAEVVALERTPQGMRRTQRWVAISQLVLPNVEETWPDGTRVLAGPAIDGMHVMVVDKANDPALRAFLANEVKPMWERYKANPRDAVNRINRLVRQKLAYNMDTDDDVSDDEVLLGDYLSAKNGVCRNYAAIAKVALDSLGVKGLKTRYISGQARDKFATMRGMHAWLEVQMPDGLRMAVDPTWMGEKEPAGGKGPGELAPISEFYKDHQHVPLYSLRALFGAGAANTNAAQAPAGPPGLRLDEVEPTILSTARSTFEKPRSRPETGVALPRAGLVKGRKISWRFDDAAHAVDHDAEIVEVDLAGNRVKIKAVERVTRKVDPGNGKPKDVEVNAKAERWVSMDAIRASVDVVDPAAAVSIDGVRADARTDAKLNAFLTQHVAPLAASDSPVPRKVTRALGRLREAWKSVAVDAQGGARVATVGDVFGASRVSDRPYAAAGVAIIRALNIPGADVRVVAGARHDKDLEVRGSDLWLELEVPGKAGGVERYGVDPRRGTVEPIAQFYAHHEYAPDYARPVVQTTVSSPAPSPRSVAAR